MKNKQKPSYVLFLFSALPQQCPQRDTGSVSPYDGRESA
jgi:hypothetical protein